MLDPRGWYFEDDAVNYYELYYVSDDYYMLSNVYTQATEDTKAALHEKLEKAFSCSGRSECDAA